MNKGLEVRPEHLLSTATQQPVVSLYVPKQWILVIEASCAGCDNVDR